jgi:four helix bundle protein
VSYRRLEIWKLAKELAISIHKMSITTLPRFEMYETGSQIRRSSKSTLTNIVEGYGRRKYKNDFIRFLYIVMASNIETISHLEILYETGSFSDKAIFKKYHDKLNLLGKKINSFIQSVQKNHKSEK